MIYQIGDTARLTVTFTDPGGTPADPTTISLLLQTPAGSQSTISTLPPIVKDDTGVYHYDLSVTAAGPDYTNPAYLYRWTGSGAVADVHEGFIVVAPTILVPQPTGVTPLWTYADLLAISKAIGTGARTVFFQDRRVEYATTEEMLIAKGIIEAYLGIGATVPARRQIRVVTSKGL